LRSRGLNGRESIYTERKTTFICMIMNCPRKTQTNETVTYTPVPFAEKCMTLRCK